MDKFIPGFWTDNVDVNDFVNLNLIPFYNSPDFLPTEFKIKENSLSFNKDIKLWRDKPFKEFLISFSDLDIFLNDLNYEEKKFDFSFNEQRTFDYFFKNTSTSSTTGLKEIGLVDKRFGSEIPPLYFPDIRQLPLYGLKKILLEKRKELKKLDGIFQTNHWIDKKIEKNREIEILNKVSKKFNNVPLKSTTNIVEIMNSFLEIILLSISENPKVTFHLPSLINFLDIFIERNLLDGIIDEEKAISLIYEFYGKLVFISNSLKLKNINFLIVETIFTDTPTKTTYRFLDFLKQVDDDCIKVTFVNGPEINSNIEIIIDTLINDGRKIKFFHKSLVNKRNRPSISHLGFEYKSDEDVILYNKKIDITSILYIALNGGKDIHSNRNIYPVYKKFTNDSIKYDKLFNEFIRTSRIIFSNLIESNNLVMYLADKYFYHPLRSSFKKQENRYSFIFSFDRITELAKIFVAIKNKNFTVVRNNNNEIKNISLNEELLDPEDVKKETKLISMLIFSEYKKLHFYQEGHFRLFFHLDINFDENYVPEYSLPTSLYNCKFLSNKSVPINSYEDIIILNEFGLNDIDTK